MNENKNNKKGNNSSGLTPLVKSLVYYYVERRYGAEGIDTDNIRLVTDHIPEEEYAYPFLDTPMPNENALSIPQKTYEPFLFADELFDTDGSYAYNLQVPQKTMMKYAKSNDGSPISFICVMQPGKNPVFAQELIRCFAGCDIDCMPWCASRFRGGFVQFASG